MKTLKNMRKKHNYSHKDMAEKLHISKTFYWQIENKKRRLSYSMSVQIANIFKTTPDKIFYKEFKNKDN